MSSPRVGVLALQGAFAAHLEVLERLGVAAVEVRKGRDLEDLAGLVIPGGESTTISMMIDRSDLRDELAVLRRVGLAVLGTCAGAILLADEVLDGRADQRSLGGIDMSIRRNAYGRQVESFETDLPVGGGVESLPAVFIRAPVIESVGPGVEVLAAHGSHPVLVRSGRDMAATFHPELTGDLRVHSWWLDGISVRP